ncbi:MAG: hypothetical protein F6K28_56730, partial [Microcoleus sp. SIO2G3]|nr:hypothetical protein [Microcoleus sp. SIO2G3]
MATTLTRPAWTMEYDIEIFNKIIAQYAPHLPAAKRHEPPLPATEQEWQNFYPYRIAG